MAKGILKNLRVFMWKLKVLQVLLPSVEDDLVVVENLVNS